MGNIYVIRDARNRYYGWSYDYDLVNEQAEIIRDEIGLAVSVEEIESLEEIMARC